MPNEFELSDDTPVYVISVAAQLSGLHPQTLRAYDRLGLVSPGAAGRGRRYSLRDILMLREVQRLSQEDGVNLSGIKRILELELSRQRSRLRSPRCTPRSPSCGPSSSPPGRSPPGWPRCAVAGRGTRSGRGGGEARARCAVPGRDLGSEPGSSSEPGAR